MVTGKTRKGFTASFDPEGFGEWSKKGFGEKFGPNLKDWETVWSEISKLRPKKKKKTVTEE